MDYLANGADPVFTTDVDEDTLHNEQVVSCIRHISDIIALDIYEAENSKNGSSRNYVLLKCSSICQPA